MRFKHTHRPGFWLGFVDFFTAGLFFLFYMPLGGLQDELDEILGRRTQRYWVAYLIGIPTLFIYPLVWMANIAEELKSIASEMGIEGPHTSWWHMFGWNTFGLLLMGPAVATGRFFSTLNRIEAKLNGNKWDGFCIYGCVKPYNHETEEETKETADYRGGLYARQPQGGKARRDCRAREAGFHEVGAPQIQEGL